jgi:hypothetical protein
MDSYMRMDSPNIIVPIMPPGSMIITATTKKIMEAAALGLCNFLLRYLYRGLKILEMTAAQKMGKKKGARR